MKFLNKTIYTTNFSKFYTTFPKVIGVDKLIAENKLDPRMVQKVIKLMDTKYIMVSMKLGAQLFIMVLVRGRMCFCLRMLLKVKLIYL